MGNDVQSAFLRIRGFNIWRVWQDAMHCLDLGEYQFIVPSALLDLISDRRMFSAPNRPSRLLLAYRSFKQFCKRCTIDCKVRQFSMASFVKRNHVICWTQHTAKAADMKALIFWLRDLCDAQCNNEYEHVRAQLFNALVQFECLCGGEGRFPPISVAIQIAECVEDALACYKYLAAACRHLGRYHMTPKGHMFTHMGYDMSTRVNPRRVACFSDEDMVGKMKKILEMCHGGTAHEKAVLRYCIWACIRWWILLHRLKGMPL